MVTNRVIRAGSPEDEKISPPGAQATIYETQEEIASLMSQPERPNPFYGLLLISSFLFVGTTLAWAVVPLLEEKAREVGSPSPPSPFREALRHNGWLWVLVELAAMFLFGLLSMGLDRLRRLQKDRSLDTIPVPKDRSPPADSL